MTKQYISNKTKLLCKRNKRNTHNTHRNKRMFTRRSTRIKKYNIKTQKAGAHQSAIPESINQTIEQLRYIDKKIIVQVIQKLETMLSNTKSRSFTKNTSSNNKQKIHHKYKADIKEYHEFVDTLNIDDQQQKNNLKSAFTMGRNKLLEKLIKLHLPSPNLNTSQNQFVHLPIFPSLPTQRAPPPHPRMRRHLHTSVDLTHVWYRNWDDHKTPEIEEFRKFIETLYTNIYKTDLFNFKQDDTIIIHCSAGVGRSGVVLIILQLMNQFAQNKTSITLNNIIERIRTACNYRALLVQTLEQFKFICKFFEINLSGITEIALTEFYKDIPQQSASQDTNEAQSLGTLITNRYKDILPYNINRVKLLKEDKKLNNYINASRMETLNINGKTINIILAQGPKDNTVTDFLQMCIEQQVRLIIMLTGLVENSTQKCADYMISAVGSTDGSSDDMVARANTGINGSLSYINKNADKQFVLYTKYTLKESSSKYSSTCIKASEVSLPIRHKDIIYNNTTPSNASNLKKQEHTSIYATVKPFSQRRPPDIPARHYKINQPSLPQTSEIPQLLPQQEPQLSDLNNKAIFKAIEKIEDMLKVNPIRANFGSNLNYINKITQQNITEFTQFVDELLTTNIITNNDHKKLLISAFTRKGRFGLLQILKDMRQFPSLPVHVPVHVHPSVLTDVNSFQQQSVHLPLQPLTDLEKEEKARQQRRYFLEFKKNREQTIENLRTINENIRAEVHTYLVSKSHVTNNEINIEQFIEFMRNHNLIISLSTKHTTDKKTFKDIIQTYGITNLLEMLEHTITNTKQDDNVNIIKQLYNINKDIRKKVIEKIKEILQKKLLFKNNVNSKYHYDKIFLRFIDTFYRKISEPEYKKLVEAFNQYGITELISILDITLNNRLLESNRNNSNNNETEI